MACGSPHEGAALATSPTGAPPRAGVWGPSGAWRELEKTRLCPFLARGRCRRGRQCTFAHDERELAPRQRQRRLQLCIDFFRTGACHVGAYCKFAHNANDVPAAGVAQSVRREQRSTPKKESVQSEFMDPELAAIRVKIGELRAQMEQLEKPPARSRGAALATRAARSDSSEGRAASSHTDEDVDSLGGVNADGDDDSAVVRCELLAPAMVTGDVDGDDDSAVGVNVDGDDDSAVVRCELLVRHTFLSLVPVDSAAPRACRRSKSFPALESVLIPTVG